MRLTAFLESAQHVVNTFLGKATNLCCAYVVVVESRVFCGFSEKMLCIFNKCYAMQSEWGSASNLEYIHTPHNDPKIIKNAEEESKLKENCSKK